MTVLSFFIFAFYFYVGVMFFYARSKLRKLEHVGEDRFLKEWPSLSIVVAAKNEEHSLSPALTTMAQLDYPNLKIIFINDRSTDATEARAREVAQKYPVVEVMNVENLPAGWLGKNHALHFGGMAARTDYVLFTDADVHFSKLALKRAITYAEQNRVDHLACICKVTGANHWMSSIVGLFGILFSVNFKHWEVRDPKSKAHVGIGAFNLLRTKVYQAIGGHQKIALRPDDDIKLGKLVKENGFHQDCLAAMFDISVEWYAKFPDFVRGLEKNTYSAFQYNPLWALLGLITQNVLFFAPFVLPFLVSGVAFYLSLASVIIFYAVYGLQLKECDLSPRMTPLLPWAALVISFTLVRAVWLSVWRGGIEWRGSFYSLKELRSNNY